jgi:hypothetical protein
MKEQRKLKAKALGKYGKSKRRKGALLKLLLENYSI